jgi:hypothetical protein
MAMAQQAEAATQVSMKVMRPDGTHYFTKHITSHEADIGNAVAEGRLPMGDYWKELARRLSMENTRMHLELRTAREQLAKAYSNLAKEG